MAITDERNLRLVELSLEQLNHEKVVLKRKIHERGVAAQELRKQMGELKKAYEELDDEMLRRDPSYEQIKMALDDEDEDPE